MEGRGRSKFFEPIPWCSKLLWGVCVDDEISDDVMHEDAISRRERSLDEVVLEQCSEAATDGDLSFLVAFLIR